MMEYNGYKINFDGHGHIITNFSGTVKAELSGHYTNTALAKRAIDADLAKLKRKDAKKVRYSKRGKRILPKGD